MCVCVCMCALIQLIPRCTPPTKRTIVCALQSLSPQQHKYSLWVGMRRSAKHLVLVSIDRMLFLFLFVPKSACEHPTHCATTVRTQSLPPQQQRLTIGRYPCHHNNSAHISMLTAETARMLTARSAYVCPPNT
ncbi:hypothetical protein DUNSADRAFT_14433, partial [Dunaliella salina]